MSVDYYLLQAADELSAIAWWAAAFGDAPAIITSAFRSDPQRFERSYVAQEPDGSIQAAITYWIRLHWLFLRLPGRGRRRVAR